MGQISNKFRRGQRRYFHYCEPCDKLHPLPDTWSFCGDLDAPTFSPSFRQRINAEGDTCHYFIRRGVVEFCGDCWHDKAGHNIELPDLPERFRDDYQPVHVPKK